MPSPEEKLLLSICRLEFGENETGNLKLLADEIKDWMQFANLANKHGIIALIAYNVRATNLANLIPDNVNRLLNDGLMQSILRNTWLTERWKEVNRILTDAGIKHVLLKGMALEHTVYGSRGLRQMTDNDILISREDGVKAWELLQEHGFVTQPVKSPLHRKIIADIGKHLPTLVKDGYALEIHLRLSGFGKAASDPANIMDNALPIKIDGITAFIPDDATHIKYLAEHSIYHQTISGPELKLFLYISLLKKDGYESINPRIFTDPSAYKNPGYKKKIYREQVLGLSHGKRLRFLAGDIFPSPVWMRQRYKCSLAGVLIRYPARLWKLTWLLF